MKNLSDYYRIKFSPSGMNISELVNQSMGIRVTGDHDVTVISFTDQQLQDLAAFVIADAALRVTAPSKTLTALEQQHLNDLARAMIADSYDVEKAANKVAAGSRSIFDQIVYRTGYASRDVYTRNPRIFDLDVSIAGSLHIILPSEGQGSFTYYYKFGPTSAINVLSTAWEPIVCIPVADLIINGFKDITILAVQYEVIVHPKHTKLGGGTKQQAPVVVGGSEILTIPTVNSAGKIVITYQQPFIHWSPVKYCLVSGTELLGSIK